jgi:hypothetical protein
LSIRDFVDVEAAAGAVLTFPSEECVPVSIDSKTLLAVLPTRAAVLRGAVIT